jgi:hypothetical protein
MKNLLVANFLMATIAVSLLSPAYADPTAPTGTAPAKAASPAPKSAPAKSDEKKSEPQPTVPQFQLGDYYQGGIIFWLDPEKANLHGLIVDTNDKLGTYKWSDADTITNAKLDGPYQGQNKEPFNTAKILATPGTTYPAANACASSQSQGYSDWYLPSPGELTMLYRMGETIKTAAMAHGGSGFVHTNAQWYFNNPAYWSSAENNKETAWLYDFSGNLQWYRKNSPRYVRCVRAF